MSKEIPYKELLKDPRWQRKRLEIFKRDSFVCRCCGDKTKTLHVHHLAYSKDRLPWRSKSGDLITLCEDCHHILTEINKFINSADFGMESVIEIIKFIEGLEIQDILKNTNHG